MVNRENNSNDPMLPLKDAKFALNARKPKQAYRFATEALERARERKDPREEAFSLHRIGSALAMIGLVSEARRQITTAHTMLESIEIPDYLGLGIMERDLALLIAEHPKSVDDRAEAVEWHQRALVSHKTASEPLSIIAERTELELFTTESFGHRLAVLENRYHQVPLWEDAKTIRGLRGDKKPGYELDALDWATRYEGDSLKILKALPRVAFLSLRVGNPITPVRVNTRPATRFISNRFE